MNNLTELFASLSPEKRALFEKQLLRKKAPSPEKRTRIPGGKEPSPLSFPQESLWFFDQLRPGIPLYNLPQAMHLRGALEVGALQSAVETILRRHESLRTHFLSDGDDPVQIVAAPTPFGLRIVDFTSSLEPERDANGWLEREAQRPFDLASDLMLRAGLLRLRPQEHILFLCLHHIAADAWSLNVLNGELTALYKSFSANEPSPLPELEFQYSDFALCQRERFKAELAAKQMAYWKERLAGEPPVLELPTDRPRPSEQSFRGALHNFQFSKSLLAQLKELSRRENVTVNSTLLAAFQILLQRYCRQDDILVGTPVGTRNHSDAEKLIGYFINTVVVRGDLSGQPTFRQFLQQTHRNILGALSHQEMPLERLVEEMKVPRHPGRNPLVQVLFQYLAAPVELPEFPGVAIKAMTLDTKTSKFDLSLTVREDNRELMGEIEFNTDLFDPSTIERFFGHYQTLLQGIVLHPAKWIGNYPLLTSAEERQLVEWNETDVAFPEDIAIPALLEQQAAATPDALAVIYGDKKLTWRELNERASRLACHLEKLGAQPDALIGICMDRSIEMLVALHGVLKSGAAFLPLDPEYPAERLAFMLQDAQAPVLLIQKHLAEKVSFAHSNIVCLDANGETLAPEPTGVGRDGLPVRNEWRESAASPPRNGRQGVKITPHPEHLAYVIYTSGSTGQPKGVMISHASICNHLYWMQSRFPLAETDRVLQKTSFSFDVAVWELFAPTLTGAALVLPRPGGHRDSAYLAELIHKEKITIFQTVPSALQALLEEPEFSKCDSLKYVVCGGEEMPRDLPERFASVSKAELANNYGPTEAAIDATCWVYPREKNTTVLPIGKPIANVQVYLLDAQLQLVPIGVPGELCVGGRGVARGYLRQPSLTAEKFIPHPFSNDPAARLYKTGDLARYLTDGNIEFLGRMDHQVKIRGFRIELGEIENSLRAHLKVRDVVVIARKDLPHENRLVAYLVATSRPAPAESDLRAHLKNNLPEFMVPSAFVFLETLPLTPNGKLDRSALPEPDYKAAESQFIAPRTPDEQELAQLWCDVLGLNKIGIHDNFFEIGGHSLLASQVVSRMRRTGRTVGLRDFFQTPTVAGLNALLQSNAAERGGGSGISPIPSLARKKTFEPSSSISGAMKILILFAQLFVTKINGAIAECPAYAIPF